MTTTLTGDSFTTFTARARKTVFQVGDIVSSKADPGFGNGKIVGTVTPRQWRVLWDKSNAETGLLMTSTYDQLSDSELQQEWIRQTYEF